MKTNLIFILIFLLFFTSECLAVSYSSSYKITTEVLDSGCIAATTSSFKLLGKSREKQLEWMISSNYRLGDWFLRTAYFTTVFNPTVLGITPSSGKNDGTKFVKITGTNFLTGAIPKLSRAGEADIIGTGITVVSSTEITCYFNIGGAAVGKWDITVTNPDTKYGTLTEGFTIQQEELEIVGRALNYPNPFDANSGPTTIRYTLTQDADIDIYFYNNNGQRVDVMRIKAGEEGGKRGENSVLWHAISFGIKLPNGAYICQITHKNKTLGLIKIAILK